MSDELHPKKQKAKPPPKPGSKRYQELQKSLKSSKSGPNDSEQSRDPQTMLRKVDWTRTEWGMVLVLQFDSSNSLKSCLGRPHVHYEGGELNGPLRGVNFPTESFLNWVASMPDGESALTIQESYILQLVRIGPSLSENAITQPTSTDDLVATRLNELDQPNYIVGAMSGDSTTLYHEYLHARFFLDSTYRAKCEDLWSTLPPQVRVDVGKELGLRGYQPDKYADEFQAYLVAEGPREFGKKWADTLSICTGTAKSWAGQPLSFKS
ncbi:hypothetical protein BJ742DRAFT_143508 [Cladochytrium replicatum]|nr:hypothetical protein BJ742DRAFT_143508 [Cladochytrium replicatum]